MLKREDTESTDSPPSDIHWTQGIGAQAECLHCGHPRNQEFCGNCGQRHVDRRLEFLEWVKLTFSRITQLDRGVLYTFAQLVIRPGHVAKEYVAGRRRPYLNPLTCFFLGAALQLLALWVLEDRLREMIGEPISVLSAQQEKGEPAKAIEERTGVRVEDLAVEAYLDSMRQGYTYLALVFLALPMAVLTRLGHSMRGEKFLLAETTVWSLYTVSVMLSVTAFTNLLLIPFIGQLAGIIGIGCYFVIVWHSHRGFFESGIASRLVTILALSMSIVCFVPSILFSFLVTFVVRIALAG